MTRLATTPLTPAEQMLATIRQLSQSYGANVSHYDAQQRRRTVAGRPRRAK